MFGSLSTKLKQSPLADSRLESVWQAYLNWLYLPSGRLKFFRISVGCLLLFSGFMQVLFLRTEPYYVPSWRIGTFFLELPKTPIELDYFIYLNYFICAFFIARGSTKFWPVAVVAAIFAFYGSREELVVTSNFQVMLFTYTLALLFAKEPTSAWRRLVQVSVSACYFFSVIQKFHPEFLSSTSLTNVFQYGYGLRPFWWPFFQSLTIPHDFLQIMTYCVIASEAFIAVGLWWSKTRLAAIILGLILHLGLSVFLTHIDYATLVMWTGYIAFWDKKKPEEVLGGEEPERRRPAGILQTLAATAVIALFVFMPARFFFFSNQPFHAMAGDLMPWAFNVFTFELQVENTGAKYLDSNGVWNDVPLEGRMKHITNDSELLVMAKYVAQKYPQAKQVQTSAQIKINKHWLQTKQCQATINESGPAYILSVTNTEVK